MNECPRSEDGVHRPSKTIAVEGTVVVVRCSACGLEGRIDQRQLAWDSVPGYEREVHAAADRKA